MALDCKQLKQKYKELLSEKEKFVLEYEKFKNGEGNLKWEDLKELKSRLEKNIKETLELLRYSGIICDSLKRLGKMNGVIISEIKDSHYNNSGDLVGRIKIGNNWYPFQGDIIVMKIAGQDFGDVDNIHSRANGDLAGRVKVAGKWYPFHGNTIVRQIAGQDFDDVYYIHTQSNGDFAGTVKVAGKWYPFHGDTIVEQIAGQDFEEVLNIHTQPNGDLAGYVAIDEFKLIKRQFIFDGEKYVFVDEINKEETT